MRRVRLDVEQLLQEAKNEEELLNSTPLELVYLLRGFQVLHKFGYDFFEVLDEEVSEHSQVKFYLENDVSIWLYVIEEEK